MKTDTFILGRRKVSDTYRGKRDLKATKMAELKMMFSNVRMAEMKQCFEKYAEGGKIKAQDFGNVMKDFGEDIAGYQLRQIEEEVQSQKSGVLSFEDFTELFGKLSTKVVGGRYKHAVDTREGVQKMESSSGTRHSFSDDEQVGFSDWINSVLEEDPDLKGKKRKKIIESAVFLG